MTEQGQLHGLRRHRKPRLLVAIWKRRVHAVPATATRRDELDAAHADDTISAWVLALQPWLRHEQGCTHKRMYVSTHIPAHRVMQREFHLCAHSSFSRCSPDFCVAAVFMARKAVSKYTAMCGMAVTRVSHERGSSKQPGASAA